MLRQLLASPLMNKNGSETGIIDSLFNATSTERRHLCKNPTVSEFAYIFTEIHWNCPSVLYPSYTPTTHPTESELSSTPILNVNSADKIFLSTIFFVVGIIGFLGNLMTAAVIYRTPKLQTQTNYFLASLAISDLLLIMVGVPFDLVSLWRESKAPAIIGYCESTSTAISWFTFSSILVIMGLTAERLVAICYPFSLRSWFTKRTVIYVIITIWILSFFPSVYIGLQFKQVATDFCGKIHLVELGYGSCDFVGWNFAYTFEVMLLLTFILPILFILYCYVRILKTLNIMTRNQTVHIPVANQTSDSSVITTPTIKQNFLHIHQRQCGPPMSEKAQKVVIKMLVTISVVFFICYLPYHVERLIVWYSNESCEQSIVCLLLYPITGLLQYISATLNPIIYNLMSYRFRTAFRLLLKRLFWPIRNSKDGKIDHASIPLHL
uniref:G-protein coupled receptors family 1 profile domain-containing protein n=1 Tax=Panagrolaimus sp. PS1159 TaxID=55785 RepID=A0AC35FPG6_9BILA